MRVRGPLCNIEVMPRDTCFFTLFFLHNLLNSNTQQNSKNVVECLRAA